MKPNVIFGLTSCDPTLSGSAGNPNNPTTPIDDTAEGKKKLWRYGYEILHLTRDDIMHHFEDVCLEIEERIEEATGVLS